MSDEIDLSYVSYPEVIEIMKMEYFRRHDFIWESKQGPINIKEMSDEHLLNTIHYLQDRTDVPDYYNCDVDEILYGD